MCAYTYSIQQPNFCVGFHPLPEQWVSLVFYEIVGGTARNRTILPVTGGQARVWDVCRGPAEALVDRRVPRISPLVGPQPLPGRAKTADLEPAADQLTGPTTSVTLALRGARVQSLPVQVVALPG